MIFITLKDINEKNCIYKSNAYYNILEKRGKNHKKSTFHGDRPRLR